MWRRSQRNTVKPYKSNWKRAFKSIFRKYSCRDISRKIKTEWSQIIRGIEAKVHDKFFENWFESIQIGSSWC